MRSEICDSGRHGHTLTLVTVITLSHPMGTSHRARKLRCTFASYRIAARIKDYPDAMPVRVPMPVGPCDGRYATKAAAPPPLKPPPASTAAAKRRRAPVDLNTPLL